MPDDAALGAFLRQRREAKAFSLDDLATATRIRPRYPSAPAALLLVLGGALCLFASAPAAHDERGVSEVSR